MRRNCWTNLTSVYLQNNKEFIKIKSFKKFFSQMIFECICLYGIGTLGTFVFIQYTGHDEQHRRGSNFALSLFWPVTLPIMVILSVPMWLDKLDTYLSPK